jgi:NADH-quinone oxidoreductase subunit N
MLVSLLSLTGIPPLAGFVAKLALFVAALEAGYAWLMVLGLINSLLSLYYYLRVVGPMFLPAEPAEGLADMAPPRACVVVAGISAALSVAIGIGAVFLPEAGLAG